MAGDKCQGHHRAIIDEENKQAHLRNRLSTADLRLSLKLNPIVAISCFGVQTTIIPGGVVHGAPIARLDRAHAQSELS